jgi:endonuclease-3
MSSLTVAGIVTLLDEEYGGVAWRRHQDPLSELVMTILSQNTSDLNSRRAFDRLTAAFDSWEAVAEADAGDIAQAIKPGGLAQVKAPRIKMVLGQIRAERGSLDLDFLGGMAAGEAMDWLRKLPGVGPKTAACVLLFSLGKPVLPVDTHIHRVAKRLGLIDFRASAETAHQVLGEIVAADDVYRFHMLMIEHGRRVCRAQSPQCRRCVLLSGCPMGRGLVGAAQQQVEP